MDTGPLLLLPLAGFAVVNGANDGASLVAMGLKVAPRSLPLAIGGLVTVLFLVPLTLGTTVAATLAGGLVSFPDGSRRAGVVIAVAASLAVVAALSARGWPTSLTLALVGGLGGAGLGLGVPVSWSTIGFVLVVAAAAPVVGGIAGLLVSRWVVGRLMSGPHVARWHGCAYSLVCLAYAANDGQKMLAVFAIAGTAVTTGAVEVSAVTMAVIAVLFGAGLVVGLRRVAETLANTVVAARPANLVSAELSAATAVLGSAAVGAPVSMTQSLAGALVGSGAAAAVTRVRWQIAARLALAWAGTLPTTALLAAGTAALV